MPTAALRPASKIPSSFKGKPTAFPCPASSLHTTSSTKEQKEPRQGCRSEGQRGLREEGCGLFEHTVSTVLSGSLSLPPPHNTHTQLAYTHTHRLKQHPPTTTLSTFPGPPFLAQSWHSPSQTHPSSWFRHRPLPCSCLSIHFGANHLTSIIPSDHYNDTRREKIVLSPLPR